MARRARLLAYTENVGQLNLSKELTCPRDNFCRFSLFFREANMSRERAKEAFAHCDPGYEAPKDPPADVSFGEGIRDMTISFTPISWKRPGRSAAARASAPWRRG